MKKLFSVLTIAVLFSSIGNYSFATGDYQLRRADNNAVLGDFTELSAALDSCNNLPSTAKILYVQANDPAALADTVYSVNLPSLRITAEGGRWTITTSLPTPLIVFDGLDNSTIDGTLGGGSLVLSNTDGTNTAGCVLLTNGASNDTIRNIRCLGVGVGAVGARVINIGQSLLDAQGGNNNNVIERDTIVGARRCIQVFGSAPLGGQLGVLNEGTIIRNNVCKNASSIGIFIGSETKDNTCLDNEVFMDAAVSVGAGINFRGINCQGTGLNSIQRNRIHDLTSIQLTSTYFGILIIPVRPTAPALSSPIGYPTTVNLINNCVTLMTANDGFVEGIDVANIDLPYTGNIYNNTVRLAGAVSAVSIITTSVALDFENNQDSSVLNVRNNIAINGKTGGHPDSTFHIGLDLTFYPQAGVDLNSDYSLAWATDPTNGWDAGYGPSVFSGEGGLELYKAATCGVSIEQHTMFKNANFTGGLNDCHLGLVGGDMCGVPLVLVPRDIDGALRSLTYPYKGADEKTVALKVLTLNACLEAVASTAQIKVAIRTSGCAIVSTGTADLLIGPNEAKVCFGDSVANAVGYYLDVTSLNHIQTASALSNILFTPGATYNFTTSPGQAFGSNQTGGPPSCFFGGDVNQDGTVDLADLAAIDNDAFNFVAGCRVNTDANHDEVVDLSDGAIADNNAFNFVTESLPCPAPVFIGQTSDGKNSGAFNRRNAIIKGEN